MNNFKIGNRVYCFITITNIYNEILISPGIYTISDILNYSSGEVYKLKEFESTKIFNHFHNSYFISIAKARKLKLNIINEK